MASGTCLWQHLEIHNVPEGHCFIEGLPDQSSASDRVHVFKDTQYSTDPNSGVTIYQTYADCIVDEVLLSDFRLNKRLCTVSTNVERMDEHIMNIAPKNPTAFWSIVDMVYSKWNNFNRYTGDMFWPSKSAALDMLFNSETNEVRCLRPVRFNETPESFAKGMLLLIKTLLTNYYVRELNVLEIDDTHIENLVQDTSSAKLRLFECKYNVNVAGFYEKYEPERYKDMVSTANDKDYYCSVKGLLDEVALRDNRVSSIPNARKLFHAIIIRLFGGHRDHIHMILCKQYLVDDKRHAPSWFTLLKAFIENRLNSNELTKSRLGITMKDFKRLYPSLEESVKLRKARTESLTRQANRLRKITD